LQRALARRLDVSVVVVSDWESGATAPSRQHVHHVLDELMAAQHEAAEIRSTARHLVLRSPAHRSRLT
jgi:predicted transcriptional regulator